MTRRYGGGKGHRGGGANVTTEKIDTAEVKNAAVVEDMVGVKNTAGMAEA
ncbi:hypothetical protein PF003_g11640 [Phytophthora fragariae]|nr:hypothetical protein PF003_g11640 [Phytophthora fragariae]